VTWPLLSVIGLPPTQPETVVSQFVVDEYAWLGKDPGKVIPGPVDVLDMLPNASYVKLWFQ
jgi:hypothetical protein